MNNINRQIVLYTSFGMAIIAWISAYYVRLHYNDLVDGEPLPPMTEVGLRYGFLLHLLCGLFLCLNKEKGEKEGWLHGIVVLQLIWASLTGLGYYLPYLSIMHKM
jgi:hypothetical protein